MKDRTILSNVPSLDSAPASLTALVLKLNPHIFTPPKLHPSQTDAKAHIEAVDNTIDLCARLLRLDATKRVTAAAALRHPFLRPVQGESKEDLVEEELLSGVDGKCGFLHGTDDGKRALNIGNIQTENTDGKYCRSRLLLKHPPGHALWSGYTCLPGRA